VNAIQWCVYVRACVRDEMLNHNRQSGQDEASCDSNGGSGGCGVAQGNGTLRERVTHEQNEQRELVMGLRRRCSDIGLWV
jgi:hypothetical protein